MYKLYTFFVGCNVLVLPLQHFTFVLNQIVLTTMKRMLNRMLRYADAIVKRGVDKLIDAIGQSPEPQTKNTEMPQPQKRMSNDTDCAPQTTGSTTNCGLTEQAITLMDELCDFRYNVLDRTPEVLPVVCAAQSVSLPMLFCGWGVSAFLLCGSALCAMASISLSTPRFTMASA